MYLPLTSLEEAWGSSYVATDNHTTNAYKSNDPQTSFIKNGGRAVTPNTGLKNELSSVTKNDIRPFDKRRVDVAIYNDILINTMYNMTPDEKTHFVTVGLLNDINRFNARTKVSPNKKEPSVEFYSDYQNYHEFENHHPCNPRYDDKILPLVTLILIIILIEKIFVILKSS